MLPLAALRVRFQRRALDALPNTCFASTRSLIMHLPCGARARWFSTEQEGKLPKPRDQNAQLQKQKEDLERLRTHLEQKKVDITIRREEFRQRMVFRKFFKIIFKLLNVSFALLIIP